MNKFFNSFNTSSSKTLKKKDLFKDRKEIKSQFKEECVTLTTDIAQNQINTEILVEYLIKFGDFPL